MRKLLSFIAAFALMATLAFAASTPPPGTNGQFIINDHGKWGATSATSGGNSFDPRSAAYGALCAGYNTFAMNGSTRTFTYTIPLTTASLSNLIVYYEDSAGFTTATILSPSDYILTGVDSGIGGTITLNSAPAAGNVLVMANDDAPGIIAASTAAVAAGGSTLVPDGCTIYGGQSTGMVLPEGAQLMGQGFTPNYQFQGAGIKPIMRIIAPKGFEPVAGINISGLNQQGFKGFEITSEVPGFSSLGFIDVPVLIGVTGSAGAGGGQSPGIVAQDMTFNSGKVGFGAPIGGSAAYIFAVLRDNNFTANNAGIYGPLSDAQIIGNDFSSNGTFGALGSSGGLVIGPQEGAVGAAGASRIRGNRFEFNREGVVIQSGSIISFDDNQFDGNTSCGLDLRTFWSDINITGGWFRGNGNGGNGTNYAGDTNPGRDAHICFNSGSGSGSLQVSNTNFYTNYSEGNTAPFGSPNATSPAYVLDFNSAAANNMNVKFNGGDMRYVFGNDGAAVTDTTIFRNGIPSDFKLNVNGQAVQGSIANGNIPSQARGLASNQWSILQIIGDAASINDEFTPLLNGWGAQVAKTLGAGPVYNTVFSFSIFDCDVVDRAIVPLVQANSQGNPVSGWLPSPADPTFGAGFYTAHLADTTACHLGGLTFAAVPRVFRVEGQSTGFVNTGTWSNNTHYTTIKGVTSQTQGDTSVGTITTNGGPIYLWYLMNGSNGGTFTYQLDSGPVSANVATQGNNAFTFPISGSSFTLGAVRIPVSTVGTHHVTVAVTSTTGSSNTVTVEGIGTPPGVALPGNSPMIFQAGQIYTNNTYATEAAVFDSAWRAQTAQLASDGLGVGFADVLKGWNFSTDTDGAGHISGLGQSEIAAAFSGVIQGSKAAFNAVNPLDYGASCNSQYFAASYCTGSNCRGVTTTSGSAHISIANYVFQPGTATQTGGGDVGKVICLGQGIVGFDKTKNQIPCTYIAAVNSGTDATMGALAVSSGVYYADMGGYPTDPADPSTAADDTTYIQTAANAAVLNGGVTYLPTNCMVHNLTIPGGVTLQGNGPGNFYDFANFATPNPQATILNCGLNGGPNDTQQCIQVTPHARYSNFMMRVPIFQVTANHLSAACLGYSITGAGPGSVVTMDHMSFFACPVAVGQAYGYDWDVGFTGSIADNGDGTSTMTVTSVDTTNFLTADIWSQEDFLAINRQVSGAGVTSGTVIIKVPPGGGAGTYILNKGMTVSSEALTSPHAGQGLELRDTESQMMNDGLGYNGDFSDTNVDNSVCTGTFMVGCWHMGPHVAGFGNGGNRITGGRMEEMNDGKGAIVCDSCNVVMTGVDMDFNGAPNITTAGNESTVQFTGGDMYAGGCGLGMVRIGGTNATVSVDGAFLEGADYGSGFGCTVAQSILFITAPAATPAAVSVIGGNTSPSGGTIPKIHAMFDFTNATPTSYVQKTIGWPVIDTSQTVLSSSFKGYVGIGTASPAAQLQLSGSISDTAWTTNGIALRAHAGTPTFTDTSSSGTVAKSYASVFGQPIFAASSATTYTDAATLTINGPPSAGTNVTETGSSALFIPSVALTGTPANAYSLNVSAPTGATNNYAAKLTGVILEDGLVSGGTKFTTSGCSISATSGGAEAGTFTLGANSCTAVITINGATGRIAPTGWTCPAWDITAPTVLIGGNTASSTATASFTIPAGAGATDVIGFQCRGY